MTELENYWPERPSVPVPQTTNRHGTTALEKWADGAQAAYEVATRLVETSFVPAAFKDKPHEATAAILAGEEVGLSPMAALRSFDIIQGQAAPRALTLRAIVQSKGHIMTLVETSATRCVMEGTRRDFGGRVLGETSRVLWTIERARALGLTNKSNWKTQPQAMLVARATSELARLIAADAILGIAYTAEELTDEADTSPPATAQRGRRDDDEPPSAGKLTARRKPPKPPPIAVEAAEPEFEEENNYRQQLSNTLLPLAEPAATDDEAGSRGYLGGWIGPPGSDPNEPPPTPDAITKPQLRKMGALMRELHMTERASALEYVSDVIQRTVETRNDLTKREAGNVIDALETDNEARKAMEALQPLNPEPLPES